MIPVQIIPFRPTTSLIMHITHHGCNNIWIIAFSKIRLTVFSYCKSFRSVEFTKFPSSSGCQLLPFQERERERRRIVGIKTRRWNFSSLLLFSSRILSIGARSRWNASKQTSKTSFCFSRKDILISFLSSRNVLEKALSPRAKPCIGIR